MKTTNTPATMNANETSEFNELTPTVQDMEQVARNYAAYIVDCAKYDIEK